MMLSDLQWPTLQSRRQNARLTMLYKYTQGLITINTQYPPTTTKQKRSARQSHPAAYDVPSHRTLYRQKTFFPRTIPDWNSLPEAVACAPSLDTLVSGLHQIL